MGYDHYFRFIKDDLIDPNIAFIQNVDNFLFCIYFNYLERYESDIKKERNKLLADLFRNIKSSLMGGDMDLGYKKINIEEEVKKILEEKDEEERKSKLSNLNFNVELSFMYPHILDKIIDLKYDHKIINYTEMEVDLILYCILVNGLNKTNGEKFDHIKNEIQPLIKILKENFCEFDKNEIHKERTFIFALRSPAGFHDDFYIINYKDDLIRKYYSDDDSDDDDNDDIECMFLHKATNEDINNDENFIKKIKCGVFNKYSLHGGKKEYKL